MYYRCGLKIKNLGSNFGPNTNYLVILNRSAKFYNCCYLILGQTFGARQGDFKNLKSQLENKLYSDLKPSF